MTEIKVGDELAFQCGYGRQWEIHRVEKITPSGRIRAGRWELDPDLRVRGKRGSFYGPYRAQRLTPEIREAAKRQWTIQRIERQKFGDLTTDQLERIYAILLEETC